MMPMITFSETNQRDLTTIIQYHIFNIKGPNIQLRFILYAIIIYYTQYIEEDFISIN